MEIIFTPENQLILCLARGKISSEVQEEARELLANQLNWDSIIDTLKKEEVYPLFYRNLCAIGGHRVPEQAYVQLHQLTKINTLQNTLLTEELLRVLRLLHDAGIPTIPLKGVTLAQSLHGDSTARVAGDIDILVPSRSVAKALHLLLASGYQNESGECFFHDLVRHSDSIEYSLIREHRGCRYILELHWAIMWGAAVDGDATEDLWVEARPKVFMNVPCYGLSPEWKLLFLAAHAARHEWQGLKWLVDIHEVCAARQVDWETVAEKSNTLRLETILSLTLSACHALFKTPIPEQFHLKTLPAWLKLFPHGHNYRFWHNTIVRLYLLSRLTDKLRFIFHGVFVPTPAERRLLRLPSFLTFLYYPLRPLRLGCKWSWSFLRGGFLHCKGQGRRAGSKKPGAWSWELTGEAGRQVRDAR